MQATIEMPKYRCHKVVYALRIMSIKTYSEPETYTELVFADGRFAPLRVTEEWGMKHDPHAGGYYVVYEDGYTSFSPAKAFEEGYTLIEGPADDPIQREDDNAFLGAVRREAVKARAKSPSSTLSMTALMEEVGELANALLTKPAREVRAEAVQVACMAMRIATEGDNTLEPYRAQQGLDRLVNEWAENTVFHTLQLTDNTPRIRVVAQGELPPDDSPVLGFYAEVRDTDDLNEEVAEVLRPESHEAVCWNAEDEYWFSAWSEDGDEVGVPDWWIPMPSLTAVGRYFYLLDEGPAVHEAVRQSILNRRTQEKADAEEATK